MSRSDTISFSAVGDDENLEDCAELAEKIVRLCVDSDKPISVSLKAASSALGAMIGQAANGEESVGPLVARLMSLVMTNARVNYAAANSSSATRQ